MDYSINNKDKPVVGTGIPMGGNDKDKKKNSKRQRNHRRKQRQQRFSDYLVFGFQSTLCLGLFVICYCIVLLVLWPLLSIKEDSSNFEIEERPVDYYQHPHVPPALKEAHLGEHLKEEFGNMKKKYHDLRHGHSLTDGDLLVQTTKEFAALKKQRKEQQRDAKQKQKQVLRNAENSDNNVPVVAGGGGDNKDRKQVTGFIVLGMHRSGTSMLSGLLHTSCGYTVGGPLIGSAFDNEKGFFELIDVVLQNDEFMKAQKVWWSANVINYDWEQALDDKKQMKITFEHGEPGLAFLNNPSNAPWLQKDPRMCITLKTWLPLMNNEPAIVFTYRHPLEVAMSLKKREQNFELERGLRLWIVYNMRAIQNSKGLCMVTSSNDAIMNDPLNEVQRIADELTSKCNVPQPPNRMKQEDVDKFVDPTLQHNAKQRKEQEANSKQVLKEYNGGKCKVYEYESDYTDDKTEDKERESDLYYKAMQLYCDFESGKAYDDNYVWPNLY